MKKFADGIFQENFTMEQNFGASAPQFLVKKLQHLQLEAAQTCIGPISRYVLDISY